MHSQWAGQTGHRPTHHPSSPKLLPGRGPTCRVIFAGSVFAGVTDVGQAVQVGKRLKEGLRVHAELMWRQSL